MPNLPRTLVENAAEWLRRSIREGRWDKGIPGLAPLAAECGIAEGTMRRAVRILEREGLVSHAGLGRRRQLTQVASKPESARRLRVGILLRDRMENEDAGFRWVLAKVRSDLEAQGHQWLQLNKTQADLKYDAARIIRLVTKTPTDLWIVVAGERPLLEWFAARPFPTFAIGGSGEKIPQLAGAGSNSLPAYGETIRKLCQLGHRRIVFLLPHFIRHSDTQVAMTWLRRELANHGIEAGKYHLPDWEETPAGLQRQLASMFKVTPPTAIFATSPVWISGILSFLARSGLKVPEDVSVVCGNHASSFLWNEPPITHFQHDDVRLARRIQHWVDYRARGREDYKQEKLPVRLVERGSIGQVVKR